MQLALGTLISPQLVQAQEPSKAYLDNLATLWHAVRLNTTCLYTTSIEPPPPYYSISMNSTASLCHLSTARIPSTTSLGTEESLVLNIGRIDNV